MKLIYMGGIALGMLAVALFASGCGATVSASWTGERGEVISVEVDGGK